MTTSETPYPDFLGAEYSAAARDAAAFHVIPVPLERSVSYGGGTCLGPRAILEASQQVESFDGRGEPWRGGIATMPPLSCRDRPGGEVRDELAATIDASVREGAVPIVLGGEHTVTLGAVRGLVAAGRTFGVVQLDAHADLRDRYEDDPLSHACVMRRVMDLGVPVFAVGVRSLSAEEARFRKARGLRYLDAEAIHRGEIPQPLLPEEFPECLYVTIDVDAMDSSLLPTTGTPEPGGLGWYTVLDILANVSAGRRVLGADLVELAPRPGLHAPDYVVAKLAYRLMGIIRPGS